ncbi:unnamed protein product, partial [Polarella glacialis]
MAEAIKPWWLESAYDEFVTNGTMGLEVQVTLESLQAVLLACMVIGFGAASWIFKRPSVPAKLKEGCKPFSVPSRARKAASDQMAPAASWSAPVVHVAPVRSSAAPAASTPRAEVPEDTSLAEETSPTIAGEVDERTAKLKAKKAERKARKEAETEASHATPPEAQETK